MNRVRPRPAHGQAAVEFVLIAPVLLLILFSMLQAFYLGLTALALQRAAQSAAREASLSSDAAVDPARGPRVVAQKLMALGPLASLNGKAVWVCAALSSCTIEHDRLTVTARIRYPMPLTVPLAGRVFGEPLMEGSDGTLRRELEAARGILRLAGIEIPCAIEAGSLRLPVRWMTFSATCFNESSMERP